MPTGSASGVGPTGPSAGRSRPGSEIAWQHSTLVDEHTDARSIGADVVYDTRIDPLMPHNAVYARAAVEHLSFASRPAIRMEIDANGYIGLYRGSSSPWAPSERTSASTHRPYTNRSSADPAISGVQSGYAARDTLPPGRRRSDADELGPAGGARRHQCLFRRGRPHTKVSAWPIRTGTGIGGGVWLTAPLFRISLMVARGLGSGTRVHSGPD